MDAPAPAPDSPCPPLTPAPQPQPKQLTDQQVRFLHYLIEDKRANAKRCAIAAGYSEDNAATHAWRMLHHPDYKHVQDAYKELLDVRMFRYSVTEDAIVRELGAIAFADKRDVITFGPEGVQIVESSDTLWPEQLAQVKSVTHVETPDGPVVNVSFHSKLEALVALAKIRGMMREKIELTMDLRIQTAAGRAVAALQGFIEREAEEDPPQPAPSSEGSQ